MPKIPNIRNTQKIMIITLKIPNIDSPKDEIITFISGFLDTILRGLKVLKSLRILKSMPVIDISMMAVITMKKSSLCQGSFR